MQTVQILNVTLDELIDRINKASPVSGQKLVQQTGTINILNKQDAAKTLNISYNLFEKLHKAGLIPCTVNAGFSQLGNPLKRWAEHHLLAIKPEIQNLKYNQNEGLYQEARERIYRILGL